MVITRFAGSVWSRGPAGSFSTCMFANSDAQRVMGSSRRILPCSISIIAAAVVTGFVIEAMRNSVSRCIGDFASMSRWPSTLTDRTDPSFQVRVTTPDRSPRSTKGFSPSATAANLGSASRARSVVLDKRASPDVCLFCPQSGNPCALWEVFPCGACSFGAFEVWTDAAFVRQMSPPPSGAQADRSFCDHAHPQDLKT